MSLRELPASQQVDFSGRRNYWGLTIQRGPWKETPIDKLNATLPATKWYGGGVQQGGTGPGKQNSIMTLDRGRVDFMPAPPGPSKYAQRRVVTGPEVLGGGARVIKERGKISSLLKGLLTKKEDIFGGDTTGSSVDHPYEPHYFDSQVGMDIKSEEIKAEMGINDDIPSLYPQAGLFERQIDTLAFLENQPSQNILTVTADANAMGERMYDEIGRQDAAAAGGYVNQMVQMPSDYATAENILHLEPMPGRYPIPVFIPPRESLEMQMSQVSETLRTKSEPMYSSMSTPTLDEEMRQEAVAEAVANIQEEQSGYVQNRVNQFFGESRGRISEMMGTRAPSRVNQFFGESRGRVQQMLGKRKPEYPDAVGKKKSRTGPAPSLKRKGEASGEGSMKKQKTKGRSARPPPIDTRRETPFVSTAVPTIPRETPRPAPKSKAPPQSYPSKKQKTKGRSARPPPIVTTELPASAQGRTGMTARKRAEPKSAPKNRDQLPSPRPRRGR